MNRRLATNMQQRRHCSQSCRTGLAIQQHLLLHTLLIMKSFKCWSIRAECSIETKCMHVCMHYTVSQKKQDIKFLAITSLTIIRFSKFFH